MADALPEQAGRADDAANPAIADGDAPTGVSILRRERYEDPRDLVGEPFIRLHESQYWRWYEQLERLLFRFGGLRTSVCQRGRW